MKRLVYFEEWTDPVGPETIAGFPDIQLIRLDQRQTGESWDILAGAHGYQLRPSTETRREFWVGPDLLARCPRLLAVSAAGAGYDMVDVEACTEAGVVLFNQTGENAESVAQHVLAMMLALSKQLIQSDRAIRGAGREWTRWDYTGHELTGRTVGIVGLGNIGRRVAALCSQLFSMRVIAYDPYITFGDFHERGAERVLTLGDLFREADFVSINCPLTAETRGMIGAGLYRLMKPNAIFITTARGHIHDEAALAETLAAGRIAGAGLDVFAEEPPPPDHPLLAFDNVVVSPHNAGVTSDCLYDMARSAAEQWGMALAGRRPPKLVNPEAWPRFAERYREMFGEAAEGGE